MHSIPRIFDYLQSTAWAAEHPDQIRFLAAGEYNENYVVQTSESTFVVRLNHGSQLGLGDQQVSYEYGVLEALAGSGVTPRPLHVNANAPGLGPVMLMAYVPGRPLEYERDLEKAATLFARIHSQPVADDLLVQADPVGDIASESIGLINRFSDHPLTKERDILLRYHDSIVRLAEETRHEFAAEPMCIVNTEVNSGNFIIGQGEHAGQDWLVDWEKAVVSHRYQDLGHFLVPTTTLWKTDHRVTEDERTAFLTAYQQHIGTASGADLDVPTLSRRTAILERTILLRALSWCYMAYYEYTQSNRPLTNDHTFSRINWYMDDIECFLK